MVAPVDDHHAILRREWLRVAAITDATYQAMIHENDAEEGESHPPSKFGMAAYKEWAGLLLRFHDAIERISKGEGDSVDMPSMKGTATPLDQDDLHRREAGPV